MDLYLIRHGHSESKEPDGKTGPHRRPDSGLSVRGRREVEELARWLPRHITQIDALYTSTMRRAAETAAMIAEAYKCEAIPDERLRDFGGNRANGAPFPNDALPSRGGIVTAQDPFAAVTQGPQGESYMDLRRRVALFLREAIQRHDKQTVIAVGHSGTIDALLATIYNVGPWVRCAVLPPLTSITHVRYQEPTDFEPWLLLCVGRTDHLVGLDEAS